MLCLVLCIVLAAAMAACGGSTVPSESTPSAAAPETTAPTDSTVSSDVIVKGQTLDYNKDRMYWVFYVDGRYALKSADQTGINPDSVYLFKAGKVS